MCVLLAAGLAAHAETQERPVTCIPKSVFATAWAKSKMVMLYTFKSEYGVIMVATNNVEMVVAEALENSPNDICILDAGPILGVGDVRKGSIKGNNG